MAKKKSKEQLKEERRRAMERKRRETGWEPPPEPDMEQEQLLADMIPLLGGAEEGAVPEHVAMIPLMELILASEDLVEEPEFDGIYAHPLLCVQAFGEAMEELGLEDVGPEILPPAEEEETRAELMEATTMAVLTDDLQEAILNALDELRERAREEGDADLVAHAAAVYSFLDDLVMDAMWSNIGVVQAVISRSLSAGLEMYEIIQEEAERAAEGKGSPGLVRRLVGATAEQKMERALARYPGLIEFMAEQTQDDWEEGAEALGVGELDLGLFSEAEISAAFAHAESLGFHLQKGDLIPEEEPAAAAAQALGQWMLSYVRDLATPERLAEMQAQIDEFAAQEEEPAWLTFLSLMRSELEEPDGSEHLYSLLVHALAGEMQNSVRKKVEEG